MFGDIGELQLVRTGGFEGAAFTIPVIDYGGEIALMSGPGLL